MTKRSTDAGHNKTVTQCRLWDTVLVPIASLKVRPRNARTHSKKQIQQVADSMAEFGFTNPLVIDAKNEIAAGHCRYEAAKVLGLDKVPVVRVEGLTEAQVRAYAIADNKLAELAGWDKEILAVELQELADLELDFDLSITGFEIPEIEAQIDQGTAPASKHDEVPAVDTKRPAVTRLGDRWRLGKHVLVCGDAQSPNAYGQLLGALKARMCITDPPYNVPIAGHVSGKGSVKHREFVMAHGEMSPTQFRRFLQASAAQIAEHSVDGAIVYIFMDWAHIADLIQAGLKTFTEMKNICVWCKNNGGMGSFYRSRHELVAVFKSGSAKHINNFGLGQWGRNRTNVWEYPGVNTFGAGREDLALHPTVKPTAMIADAIKDCSRRNDVVLDSFCGSGSTIIAAEITHRRAYCLELDPLYCDVAIRRWEKLAADSAVLDETGQTFAEVAAERAGEGY